MKVSRKGQICSSFRQPEKHFWHQVGHRRAGAVKGSVNIPQNSTVAVNRVEHQQTVNIKKGQKTIWFSEVLMVIPSILAVNNSLKDIQT